MTVTKCSLGKQNSDILIYSMSILGLILRARVVVVAASVAAGLEGEPCVKVSEPSTSAAIVVANTCQEAKQFTIKWSGSLPATTKTYRIRAKGSRQVSKLDKAFELASEGSPSFGVGRPGEVSVQEAPTSVKDIVQLRLSNEHSSFAFVELKIRTYNINPAANPPSAINTIRVVLEPKQSLVVFTFDKTLFSRYNIESQTAEDDPQ